MIVYIQRLISNGKFGKSSICSEHEARESLDVAFSYFTINSKNISYTISTKTKTTPCILI
ncbi:hypothetical protein FQ087_09115 [Sporosarcina sp. ANT_H38]|nr:hypothetical protein FQ087_09115 [Sporosarcina sp. ANT_H38]